MVKIKHIGKCLVIEIEEEKEKRKILAVGDLHLGYEEALERGGTFVGRGLFTEMLKEIREILENAGKIDEIVLLGDVKHEFGRVLKQESGDFGKLVNFLEERTGKIVVVKGNHDKIIEQIGLRKVEVKEKYIAGCVCFVHGDKDFKEMHDREIKYWIMGHGHPAVVLKEGVKEEKYKCFLEGEYEGKKVIILPSFLEYIEGSDPREFDLGMAWNFSLRRFRVRIIDKGLRVYDFGELQNLK